jgi:hypothetical protein
MNKLFTNEQMFEEANRKVAAATAALAPSEFPPDFTLELYCECANKACQERLSIAYGDYKRTKHESNRFTVKPEHYLPEFERLEKKTPGYWIVVKKLDKLSKPFEV